jgi:PhnB protein
MKVKAIPQGYGTVTTYFSVRGAPRFIEFLTQAFDAKNTYIAAFPDGTVLSAEVRIGDSMVVIGEDDSDPGEEKRSCSKLYMYVDDVDVVYTKALQAGAKSIAQPADQFWGDRSGVVEDIAGNQWWIATHREDVSSEELIKRAMKGQ